MTNWPNFVIILSSFLSPPNPFCHQHYYVTYIISLFVFCNPAHWSRAIWLNQLPFCHPLHHLAVTTIQTLQSVSPLFCRGQYISWLQSVLTLLLTSKILLLLSHLPSFSNQHNPFTSITPSSVQWSMQSYHFCYTLHCSAVNTDLLFLAHLALFSCQHRTTISNTPCIVQLSTQNYYF